MQSASNLVIFTDLDGTLLDHDTYSWEPARPALMRVRSMSIPLIAVSSKTLSELEDIQAKTGLFDGLIAENGGVISLDDTVEQPGPATSTIDTARSEIQENLNIPVESFRTVSPDIIAKHTGLPIDDAMRAGTRRCSDPLIWDPDETAIKKAQEIATEHGLKLVKGGRFHTLCGQSSKGAAMTRMIEKLGARAGNTQTCNTLNTGRTTIALGDSANDIPMLQAADIAIQIPSKHGDAPTALLDHPNLTIAPHPGPAGWNAAITTILDHMARTKK
ncbi:HAD-IIB family hydrolase [Thalassospira sp. MA62]|nr:HAD-IIB family hydrolase [Thalassospira sp. MA62]